MEEANQVLLAQKDPAARERLIAASTDFICRCASKATGKFVDRHDDAYSEAMIAFNNAITAYDAQKGSFSAFAAVSIHHRVTDYIRKEMQNSRLIPFSSIAEENCGKEFSPALKSKAEGTSDIALEIYSLKQELIEFDISFFDLPSASPKAKKTKFACNAAIRYITGEAALLKSLRKTKCLPVQQLTQKFQVSPKILERYRKYIITGVLICDGNYDTMKGYFDCGEGGSAP